MFWLIHLIAGMIIAKSFNSVILIAIISFLSHFLIDMVPHWDGYFDKEKFEKLNKVRIKKIDVIIRGIDFILTIGAGIYFYYKTQSNILIFGGFMALLPDIIKIGYFTNLRKNKIYLSYLKFHSRIEGDAKIAIGLLIQFLTFTILLYILFRII